MSCQCAAPMCVAHIAQTECRHIVIERLRVVGSLGLVREEG